MDFSIRRLVMAAVPAIMVGILGLGCNVNARRDARRDAFDPLRPDPAYRILPDRPLHLRDAVKKNADPKEPPVPVTAMLVEPPVIWKAKQLDEAGLDNTSARFHGQTVEVYFIARMPFRGELVAFGKNERMEEIARVRVPVDFKKDDARFVVFELPGKLAPNELKVVSIDMIAE